MQDEGAVFNPPTDKTGVGSPEKKMDLPGKKGKNPDDLEMNGSFFQGWRVLLVFREGSFLNLNDVWCL